MADNEKTVAKSLDNLSNNITNLSGSLREISQKMKTQNKNELNQFEQLLEFVDEPNRIKDWNEIPKLSITKIFLYIPRASYIFMTLFFLLIFYFAVGVLLPQITLDNLLVAILAIIAVVLQLIGLLSELSKNDGLEPKIRSVVEWNYKRVQNISPVKDKPQLLKAAILLKVTEINFSLVELHKTYPEVFNERNAIAKLYEIRN